MYTRSKGPSENDPALQESEADSVLTNTIDSDSTGDTTVNTSPLVDLNQTIRGNLLETSNTMVNQLDFITAIKTLPNFSGGSETDLASFISQCEFVFSKIPDTMTSDILHAVLTKLKGNAFDAIRYREINSWEELKSHLETIFSTSHSLQYLRGQLNTMKLGQSESIKDFAQRVEKAYHELTRALTKGKSMAEAKIHAQSVQEHALSVFIGAVQEPIKIILLSRNVSSFEEAVLLAIEQESVFAKATTYAKPEYKNNVRNNTRNNFKSNFKKTGNRPNVDKSAIKCFRCDRIGHYANECRTLEQNIIKRPEIKKEYTGQVRYCKYCKLKNHDISECRKIRDRKNAEGEPSGSSSNSTPRTIGDIKNNIRLITPINAEHILCRSRDFIPSERKFLIDSGADMNIIKLSMLKEHIVVNEVEKRHIKGISATTILTIGTVVVDVFIKDKKFNTKFDIVYDDFPIPEAGILGIAFQKKYKAITDWDKGVLIIPEPTENQVESIIIPARSNRVLQVKADEIIHSELVAIKKYAKNDDVIIANSLSPVLNNEIVSNINNISEQPFIIDELTTSIPSSFHREPEEQYNYDNYVLDLKHIMQEAHKLARTNLIEKKETNKHYYDKNTHAIKIQVGDKVLIKKHNKRNTLSRNWTGPYEVLAVHDNENITINKGRKGYRIHINNVKLFYETEL